MFWGNINSIILEPNFGIRGVRLWKKDTNMSWKKIRVVTQGGSTICMSFVTILFCLIPFYFIMNELTLIPCKPYFGIYYTSGKEFRMYWPSGFDLEQKKFWKYWWRERFLVYRFKDNFNKIVGSFSQFNQQVDKFYYFWDTVKGKLPTLSYIFASLKQWGHI